MAKRKKFSLPLNDVQTSIKKEEKIVGHKNVSFFSWIFMIWLYPLLMKGNKRPLQQSDLQEVRDEDKSEILGDLIEKKWKNEREQSKLKNGRPNLMKVIFRCFGVHFIFLGFLLFTEECLLRIWQPICLGGLIRYFSNEEGYTDAWGLAFATVIWLSCATCILAYHPRQWGIQYVGMRIRIACSSAIYRKVLKLSRTTMNRTTGSHVVNLLSNDVGRFDTSLGFIHYLWIAPLQLIVFTTILWQEIGPSCLVGIAYMLLFAPLQAWIGKVVARLRMKTAAKTDERIRVINEVINSIRVIKLYAWEKAFIGMITLARKLEMNIIRKTNYYSAVNIATFFTSSKMVVFLSLLIYLVMGNALTAEKVFVTISLIDNICLTMTLFFPYGITMASEICISCKRIQNSSVTIKNMTAKWSLDESKSNLKNISCEVKAGELLVVIGQVGSGKSSLLNAILGELHIHSGEILVKGRVAYAAQEPWIFSGTVRENILYGQEFDQMKYKEVLKACALVKDLQILDDKDQTLVGEKGAFLSGGQKARINLARALYFNADIYLLDDPLSAVDSEVGRHLFEECILKHLKKKVCILATHQVQFVKEATKALVLCDGLVEAYGSALNIIKEYLDVSANSVSQNNKNAEINGKEMLVSSNYKHCCTVSTLSLISASSVNSDHSSVISFDPKSRLSIFYRRGSTFLHSIPSTSSLTISELNFDQAEEERSEGSVSGATYKKYFMAGGGVIFLAILFLSLVSSQILFTGIDYWLSLWSDAEQMKHAEMMSASSQGLHPINETFSAGIDQTVNVYIYAGDLI